MQIVPGYKKIGFRTDQTIPGIIIMLIIKADMLFTLLFYVLF